ncbi:MAG: hypothetical protein U9Q81_09695 [Pseudomonadota bacterium]|nr:hypothetical protein [Pseudomonadota bacterium]
MLFQVDEAQRRKAKSPHELAMVNLLLFNLPMLIALLAGSFVQKDSPLADYKVIGVLVPLFISLGVVAFTFMKARKTASTEPWFVASHWKLATGRYKILLIAYLVGAVLIGLGWLLSQAQSDPRMQELMFIALQRVAIAPILISLMVLIMLESGSLYQAGRGEVPDALTKRFPPPPDLVRADPMSSSATEAAG